MLTYITGKETVRHNYNKSYVERVEDGWKCSNDKRLMQNLVFVTLGQQVLLPRSTKFI